MAFLDTVDDLLLGPATRLILDGVKSLLGGDDDDDDDSSPQDRVNQVLYGGNGSSALGPTLGPAPTGPPPVPGGPSGLQQGADQAGGTYQQAGGAVALTDEKLAGLLKQIFASNDEMRSKISGIINEIETRHKQVAADPKLANDPNTLKAFQQYVDGKLGEIQQLLDNSKMDSKKQAELLAALGDEYRNNTGGDHSKDGGSNGGSGGNNGGGSGGEGGGAGSGGSGGDPGGSAGGDPTGGAPAVTDPLAGMGGLPAAGIGDPLSMLGPALAGLGSTIPGALGGAGGSLPLDALGGLAPLASELAGHGTGDGFTDDGSRDHTKPADFVDDGHGKSDGDGGKNGEAGDTKDDSGDKKSATSPAPSPPPQAQQPASAAAVPASAGGDPARVVQMPDGTPVTAPSAQNATAMRAVLNGSTVTDGWKQANVDLPPPGTPVTAPADPSHLVPGECAQFKTREPVMYMGNGKIWLDGQLQPQSALPTADFLGWFDPTQQAGVVAAPSPGPNAPSQPNTGT